LGNKKEQHFGGLHQSAICSWSPNKLLIVVGSLFIWNFGTKKLLKHLQLREQLANIHKN
jgi:hypothetical protein